ncbi:methylenetetrahydrofolate reductase [Bacillus carboniphilus]|uniref:Methylenetetrahydrofolate reductase n=1 Tax=Bacillus carboniphilus TaxID=86663 RepID=A0ABY9JPN1_9BACI|nr:methylenetetrahydrofolate reductase [Bacillus carboniphilus]WLR41336.1 methylenetetrahydrofolate reductase [Bacillus carboniphilus]
MEKESCYIESAGDRTTVIVELDPPKEPNLSEYLRGVKELEKAGADTITIADNSMSYSRICNTVVASIIKSETSFNPLVHIACRDRNLIGQQSRFLGLHILGLDKVMIVTGDPPRSGDLPQSKAVFETNSINLMNKVKGLNDGQFFSGDQMKSKTVFKIGGAINQGKYGSPSLERIDLKIKAGCRFFLTQPFYSKEMITRFAESIETYVKDTVIFIGIMPLVSFKNAQFLDQYVSGVNIPSDILSTMAKYKGDDAKKAGIEIAINLAEYARRFFKGLYLITPFMKYDITAEICSHMKKEVLL